MSGAAPARQFDGRCAVVTGVGRAGQVGEVVAKEFAKRGATVSIIDRDAASAEALAGAMRAGGLTVSAFGCDLTDAAATAAVFAQIAAANGGKIHALANVAGGFAMSGPVGESDPAIFQRQLSINLGSAYGATRACIPFMRTEGGGIVFMAAAAILPGGKVANVSGYAASKAGVTALMRAVAQEERAHGIRANALAPTAIRTGANLDSMGDKFAYVERESVAAVIAFLCSGEATNITGQVIELA
ncbi:MAG TPA: SDR family oxidoreductase [Gemmatimonadaceae bacterium]|jgi:3-oxoacyl-[acyl-carrier protein] reductase|nr:SDR family oxidoreductase [Gemmatimonadaceae bacterium]